MLGLLVHIYLFLKHRETEGAEQRRGKIEVGKFSVFLRVVCPSVFHGGTARDTLYGASSVQTTR